MNLRNIPKKKNCNTMIDKFQPKVAMAAQSMNVKCFLQGNR